MRSFLLSLDSRSFPLEPKQEVRIRRAGFSITLINPTPKLFFHGSAKNALGTRPTGALNSGQSPVISNVVPHDAHLSIHIACCPAQHLGCGLHGPWLGGVCQFNRRGASREIAFQLGSAWYTGDLNPTNMFRGMSHVSQGAFYRHNLNSRLSIRGQYLRGMIEMWDADHPNAWQQERNLHFRNDLREYALLGELNYRDHVVGRPMKRMVPFLFAGLAVYTHDPEAQDRLGNWQPLQPLGTEGKGFEEVENYLNWGVAVPYGIGIKALWVKPCPSSWSGAPARRGPITSMT